MHAANRDGQAQFLPGRDLERRSEYLGADELSHGVGCVAGFPSRGITSKRVVKGGKKLRQKAFSGGLIVKGEFRSRGRVRKRCKKTNANGRGSGGWSRNRKLEESLGFWGEREGGRRRRNLVSSSPESQKWTDRF